jgi:hypothetical protein
LATRFGVSVLKVVATIDTPMSHHGAARPEVKNSVVSRPARRIIHNAGMNDATMEATTMVQSRGVKRMYQLPASSFQLPAASGCQFGTSGRIISFQPPIPQSSRKPEAGSWQLEAGEEATVWVRRSAWSRPRVWSR